MVFFLTSLRKLEEYDSRIALEPLINAERDRTWVHQNNSNGFTHFNSNICLERCSNGVAFIYGNLTFSDTLRSFVEFGTRRQKLWRMLRVGKSASGKESQFIGISRINFPSYSQNITIYMPNDLIWKGEN